MKLYADEGVERQIVAALRAGGHDVAYAAETDPAIVDEAVLGKATAEGRLLLATDKDFGELVYRLGRASGGVRLAGLSAELKSKLVVEAFASRADELPGAFSVLSPGLLRIRRGSTLPK